MPYNNIINSTQYIIRWIREKKHECHSFQIGVHATVGVKIKFPFSFRSTELNRYTVLTKNSYKTNKHL